MGMKAGCMSLAYSYTDMTILFSDICDFTKFCASHTAEQAVSLVTQLFAELDMMTVNLGLYKVCTIGDAYVVTNQPRRKQLDIDGDCARILTLGKWMIRTIFKVREEVGQPTLNMRIGIHCGSFVGGVIGTQRLRFDVWGPDVLAGQMVEQNGLPGHIVVSHRAKRMLEHGADNNLCFSFHKTVELRNRGAMETYLCLRKDGKSLVAANSDVDCSDSDDSEKSPVSPVTPFSDFSSSAAFLGVRSSK